MGQLTVRENWVTKTLRWMRVLSPVITDEHDAGLDFHSTYPARPGYDPLTSMSAMAAFPYVQAAVLTVAGDMAGLPLTVSRGTGDDSKQIPDHPFLDLMAKPNAKQSGTFFRMQMWVDWLLTGDFYARKIRDRGGVGEVVSLYRLHPHRVEIYPDSNGTAAGYRYSGGGTQYDLAWQDVVHIQAPSWEDTPQGLYGTGWIRALSEDLTSDLELQKSNRQTFTTGSPTMIATPKDGTIDGDLAQKLTVDLNTYLRKNRGGAIVSTGALDFEDFGYSPKDMEGEKQRDWTRRAIIAVSHVPPIKLGLETANFATAEKQDRAYWVSQLKRAKLVDDGLSELAAELGSAGDTVDRDTSDVEALQESRTDQQKRVKLWVDMGMDPNEAAAYEGFSDAPVMDPARANQAPAEQEETDADQRAQIAGNAEADADGPSPIRSSASLRDWLSGPRALPVPLDNGQGEHDEDHQHASDGT